MYMNIYIHQSHHTTVHYYFQPVKVKTIGRGYYFYRQHFLAERHAPRTPDIENRKNVGHRSLRKT